MAAVAPSPTEKTEGEEVKSDENETGADEAGVRQAGLGDAWLPTSVLSNMLESKGQWEWWHKTGWREYDLVNNRRIESAYQRGEAKLSVKSAKDAKSGAKGVKPVIIFFHDMIQYDPTTQNTRDIRRKGSDSFYWKLRRKMIGIVQSMEDNHSGQDRLDTFEQYKHRKRKMLFGATHDFSGLDTRHDSLPWQRGLCKRIVKHTWFDNLLMTVVLLNAVWIALEADYNDAPSMADSRLEFQVIEHCFCTIFFFEILLRFCSYDRKRECLNDGWFRFDLTLVILMVVETWLIPLILFIANSKHGSSSALSNLSVLRLARLVRLTRVTRLVRWCPEMITLLKGILQAMRSVMYTLLLLLLLLFVFGIMFKTYDGLYPDLPDTGMFITVRRSMWSLLLHGIFLDDVTEALDTVHTASDSFVVSTFIFFIFLGSYTIMNMLIGFQCEVASRVSNKDKENAMVDFLQHNLLPILECYDQDGSRHLEKAEFLLVLQDPQVHDILSSFGTQVRDLMNLSNIIYEDKLTTVANKISQGEEHGTCTEHLETNRSFYESRLSFNEFLEAVLRLRGASKCSVTDIVELRDYMRHLIDHVEEKIEGIEKLHLPKKANPLDAESMRMVAEMDMQSFSASPQSETRPEAPDAAPPAWAVELMTKMSQMNTQVEKLTQKVDDLSNKS